MINIFCMKKQRPQVFMWMDPGLGNKAAGTDADQLCSALLPNFYFISPCCK